MSRSGDCRDKAVAESFFHTLKTQLTHHRRYETIEQLEGELIKKQVEEELEREKLRDLDRLKRAAKTREDFKKANEDLLQIQA